MQLKMFVIPIKNVSEAEMNGYPTTQSTQANQ